MLLIITPKIQISKFKHNQSNQKCSFLAIQNNSNNMCQTSVSTLNVLRSPKHAVEQKQKWQTLFILISDDAPLYIVAYCAQYSVNHLLPPVFLSSTYFCLSYFSTNYLELTKCHKYTNVIMKENKKMHFV